jgi:hypothetical protein
MTKKLMGVVGLNELSLEDLSMLSPEECKKVMKAMDRVLKPTMFSNRFARASVDAWRAAAAKEGKSIRAWVEENLNKALKAPARVEENLNKALDRAATAESAKALKHLTKTDTKVKR